MPHGPRRFPKSSKDGSVRHFRLVARSQYDPEGDNPDSTPLVLEPFVPTNLARKDIDEADHLNIPESLQHIDPEIFGLDTRGGIPEERLNGGLMIEEGSDDEEIDELAALDDDCYFPKDGYNYNQHLKTLSSDKKKGGYGGVILDAPKKEKESIQTNFDVQPVCNEEESEVMKALEDADNPGYEELDDDLLEVMLPSGAVDLETALWGPTAHEYDDLPDLAEFKAMHAARLAAMRGDADDEGDYEGCADVSNTEHFQQLLEDEYGDEEIGAMEDDEIEGHITMENMEDILDEFLEERDAEKNELESMFEPIKGKYDEVPRVIDETKAIIERHNMDHSVIDEDAETTEGESEEDESKNWDCETVLSTLSNLSNRPGKIERIKKVKKPTKELTSINEDGKDDDEDEDDSDDVIELPDVITERPKNESAEDKKARKASVKEMKRICREMKKKSKETYKNEAKKLSGAQVGTGDVRQKLRCQKL
mmetsp:Transcript_43172/g.68247  ORF Transcript_43172/g.68247 Transcript_43172/m.68247 type:complete len:480 (+) Transcript_43172:63-1502(+)